MHTIDYAPSVRGNTIISSLVLALARHPLPLVITLTQGFLLFWLSVP